MKKRIATLALLAGLVAAPGFVADAHAGRNCDRRSHDRYDRYDRYDSGYRGGYSDDYRYERPRYHYVPAYGYEYAPRRAFVLPFPPPFLSFHFGHH